MTSHGDAVAEAVLKAFRQLPTKAQPRTHPDGSREWTVLSGILLSRTGHAASDPLECVALGTGMRCLPHARLPSANGICLHDWHAEVVAARAFNLFLLQECSRLAEDATFPSQLLRSRRHDERDPDAQQPFAIRDDVAIHMYCSEAPCGDASMELTMDAQADATAWQPPGQRADGALLDGRGFFSQLGVVRRKPARADAPPTMSKSCSDKLALKQCISLLSSVTSLLVHPGNAYLHSLVIPDSQCVAAAVRRAFGADGRMAPAKHAQTTWKGGYAFRPFKVVTTATEFEYCRPRSSTPIKSTGSNVTAVWTPATQEVLIGGTIQGNKQFSLRGASSISRARLWNAAWNVASAVAVPALAAALRLDQSYKVMKTNSALKDRRAVKQSVQAEALKNWPKNGGDDDFFASDLASPSTSNMLKGNHLETARRE